jgi:hypothetical protein
MEKHEIDRYVGKVCEARVFWIVRKNHEVLEYDHRRNGTIRICEQPRNEQHPLLVIIGDYVAYADEVVWIHEA